MTADSANIPSETPPAAWTLLQVSDPARWEQLAAGFKDYNYRQTWTYGLVSADRYQAEVERIAVTVVSELVGIAEVRLKAVPWLGTGIAYVGGGPLARRGTGDDLRSLRICLEALREEYLVKRGYTLRLLPSLDPSEHGYEAVHECFQSCGFQDGPWPPPYHTLIVDIDRPLPEIRRTLAQKWRNCLNRGERENLTVRSGNEPELFEQFERLYNAFVDRKGFGVEQAADFYSEVRARAKSDEGYVLSIAYADGAPVAGHLASMLGDTAVYMLGANTELGMKHKAAYVLQWHAIVTAQQRGMRWYDLGGIEPVAMPGVYHFKVGMGGHERSSAGPFQLVPAGFRGLVVPAMEKLYRWSRVTRLDTRFRSWAKP